MSSGRSDEPTGKSGFSFGRRDDDPRPQKPGWETLEAPKAKETRKDDDESPLEISQIFYPQDRHYKAFEVRTRPENLIILTARTPALVLPYHDRRGYSFDQHQGEFLTLFYPHLTAHITGQRLGEAIHAFIFGRCILIREWHRDFYDPPGRGVPLIEKIELLPPATFEPKAEA